MPIDEGRWATLADILGAWFREHRRDLPWRRHYAPYAVWISEILLQQTQMERGVAYYLRWMDRFPDVASVASASEEDILKAWEGLGYYARARNLHRAAQAVMVSFGGELPADEAALRRLPGIGAYTAGALMSIAFNLPVPALDANGERFLARFEDEPAPVKSPAVRRRFEDCIRGMMAGRPPREVSQALMEFGALVCTPKSPDCTECLVHASCLACRAGTVEFRPTLPERPPLRHMWRVAGVLRDAKGRILLRRRPSEGLWGGLWEFPGEDGPGEAPEPVEDQRKTIGELFARDFGWKIEAAMTPLGRVRYSYTVHRVVMTVFSCCLAQGDEGLPDGCRWVDPAELPAYALASGNRAVARILDTHSS